MVVRGFVYISFFIAQCIAQQSQPFTGRGDSPPVNGSVEIWTSVFLHRLLAVDQTNYLHTHVLYIIFNWYDPRVLEQVQNATAERPGDLCGFKCQTGSTLCCDTIWLPGIDLQNVYELPEGRLERNGIIFDTQNRNNHSVTWYQKVMGTYYSTMSFRDFPFDSQALKVTITGEVGWNLTFLASQSGVLNVDMELIGDDVTGWKFKSLDLYPWKLQITGPHDDTEMTRTLQTYNTTDTDPQPPFHAEFSFAKYLTNSGVDIYIIVERNSSYFVFNVLTPIILTVLMAFSIYWIDPVFLEERLGVVITLFLALTALQFVINGNLPSSSYFTPVTTQILFSYIVLFLCILESLCVFYLVDDELKDDKRTSKILDRFPGAAPPTPLPSRTPDTPPATSDQSLAPKVSDRFLTPRDSVTNSQNSAQYDRDTAGPSNSGATVACSSPCPLIDNKQRKESFAYNAVINDGDMALPVGGSESGLMQINQDTDAANETKNEVINENPMKEKPRFHRTWFLRRRARLGTNNDAKLSTREEQGDTAATERIVRKHRDCYNSFFGPLHRLKADKHRARKCARLVDSCSLLVLTVGYVLGIYLIFKLNTTDQASNFAD